MAPRPSSVYPGLLPQEIEDQATIDFNDAANRFLNEWIMVIFWSWSAFLAALVIKCLYYDQSLTPDEEETRRKEQRLLVLAELEVERKRAEDKKKEINDLYLSYGAEKPFPN